jgi:EmrB/QacA subfamily drug resistance transporter
VTDIATLPAHQGASSYKWIVTTVVVFGAFMTILDQTIVNIAIPHLQSAFGADLHNVQWVLTAYIMTQGIATPTTAFFADRLGAKGFYILALSLFTLGSALCGLAWDLPALVAFRIVQGIGGAFLFPLAITLMYREFPVQQRGIATGVLGIAALLAPAIGPTLGGYFVTYLNWRLIFLVNAPVGIIGVTLALILLRKAPPQRGGRFDAPGFVFAATGLAAILYALADAGTDGWTSPQVLGAGGGGIAALAIFVIVELAIARSGGTPLVNLRLFGNGPFLTSNITNIFVTFGFFGGLFLFPIYLQTLRGLDAFQAGLLLLPQAAASMLMALIGGRLVDRIGVRPVIIPGLALMALTFWLCAQFTLATPFGWIEVVYTLRGLALGLIIQPLTVSALSDVPPPQFTQASSMGTVVRFVATSLGIATLATLVQSQAQTHARQLAAQIVPGSPWGDRAASLQAQLIQQGMDPTSAHQVALRQVMGLVRQQGTLLAINDAFWLSLGVTALALLAAAFISLRRTHFGAGSATPATPEEAQLRDEAMVGI